MTAGSGILDFVKKHWCSIISVLGRILLAVVSLLSTFHHLQNISTPALTMIYSATFLVLYITTVCIANEYGVDTSWPIHYQSLTDASNQLFGNDKTELYDQYIKGCQKKYPHIAQQCIQNENERFRLNRNQPKQMTNYTDTGYKKVRLSDDLFATIQDYWQQEVIDKGGIENLQIEEWPEANTYTNHWDSPSRMKHLTKYHAEIWRETEAHIREWIPSAKSFSRSSLYGIRVYTANSILATHVDRDPLITSAIINVAQDVGEDWPVEVYDHEGQAQNITMQPGDMVLYESHSILHGRPFPLKGRYFANIFVHFKPLFHDAKFRVGDIVEVLWEDEYEQAEYFEATIIKKIDYEDEFRYDVRFSNDNQVRNEVLEGNIRSFSDMVKSMHHEEDSHREL